jgi:hypothetical protein
MSGSSPNTQQVNWVFGVDDSVELRAAVADSRVEGVDHQR